MSRTIIKAMDEPTKPMNFVVIERNRLVSA